MQQTSLDRWMRKRFVYVTRVYCNTLPADLPPGLTVEEAPEESGGRYLYKLTTTEDSVLAGVVREMNNHNITYTSRIEDKKAWYSRFLNDPNKSFTFRCIWILFGVAGLVFALSGAPQAIIAALMDEEVVEEVVENEDEDIKVFHKRESLYEIDRMK